MLPSWKRGKLAKGLGLGMLSSGRVTLSDLLSLSSFSCCNSGVAKTQSGASFAAEIPSMTYKKRVLATMRPRSSHPLVEILVF